LCFPSQNFLHARAKTAVRPRW